MTMGKAFQHVMEQEKFIYNSTFDRYYSYNDNIYRGILARIKSLFTKEQPAMCDKDIDLRSLTCVGRSNILNLLNLLVEEGVDPTITRATTKWQGWSAKVTKKQNFLKVASGHYLRYYAMTADKMSLYDNPFYNVERIISITGERDDIHKKTKQKAA